jgi:serine/threonine-protein kinase
VVHRDIKPGNLLLDERHHVHVADFGVASASGLDSFTKTGTILGTAGYMSPEQATGRRATPASDRYALAVVAWELLTGQRPFASPNPTSEAAAHANAPIPSIRAANPRLPSALERVFQRALAKDPEARHQTAAAFVADLRRALRDGGEGDGWPRPTRALPPPPPRLASRGHRWWLPILLALLAGAGAFAAYLGTQSGSKHGSSPPARTVVRTVTRPGTTVQQTVTAPAATQPSASPATPSTAAGAALNDAGYLRMQAGDYVAALPLLEQAVQRLQGTGVIDEAYADYNLAFTRYALGDCTDVLVLLDRAQSIEGHKRPIDDLRKQATKACGKRG